MDAVSLASVLATVLADREKHAAITASPKGFFVHVRVPPHVADRLESVQHRVLPAGAHKPDIDHVTLVYTRRPPTDHSSERVHAALSALREVGEQTEPIDARIQGWAYFDGVSRDGKPATALVALLDAPGLEHLHVDASRALADHGIEASDKHVFTPHITIGWLPQHGRVQRNLEPLAGRFTIDKIHVASRDHHEIPLSGLGASQKAAADVFKRAMSPPGRVLGAPISLLRRDVLLGAGLGAGLGALGSVADYATDSPGARATQPFGKRFLVNAGMGALGGGVVGATHRMTRSGPQAVADLVDSLDQQRYASIEEIAARLAHR